MTINEAIEAIKTEGNYTEDNLENLKKAIEEANIESFSDERFKTFAKFINDMPYHAKVQEMVSYIGDKLISKGITPPCFGNCSEDSCALHAAEF